MIIYGPNIHIIQHRHHLLCQPYILIRIAHLNAVLLITNRGNIGQVLRRTGTDGYSIFFLFQVDSPFWVRKIELSRSVFTPEKARNPSTSRDIYFFTFSSTATHSVWLDTTASTSTLFTYDKYIWLIVSTTFFNDCKVIVKYYEFG